MRVGESASAGFHRPVPHRDENEARAGNRTTRGVFGDSINELWSPRDPALRNERVNRGIAADHPQRLVASTRVLALRRESAHHGGHQRYRRKHRSITWPGARRTSQMVEWASASHGVCWPQSRPDHFNCGLVQTAADRRAQCCRLTPNPKKLGSSTTARHWTTAARESRRS